MSVACPECGNNPGFDWAVCPECGASAGGGRANGARPDEASSDRWERTIVDHEAVSSFRERAKFSAGRGDFYNPVGATQISSRPEGLPPFRGDDEDDESDRTIIDRAGRQGPGDDADDDPDSTQFMRGGRKGATGPLVYLVQRTGIRAGKVHLLGSESALGRSPDNDIVLGDNTVSRHHAKVRVEDGQYFFWDLASANHSYVIQPDGTRKRIFEPHRLEDKDSIELGEARVTFLAVDRAPAD